MIDAVAEAGTVWSVSTENRTFASRCAVTPMCSTWPTRTPAMRTLSPVFRPVTSVNVAL